MWKYNWEHPSDQFANVWAQKGRFGRIEKQHEEKSLN